MAAYGTGPAAPGYLSRPKVRLELLSEAFTMFGQQAATWIISSVIVFVVAIALFGLTMALYIAMVAATAQSSIGFLAGLFGLVLFVIPIAGILAMTGGQYRMALKQMRGEPIAVGDLFSVTDIIGPIAITALLIGLFIMLGAVACIVGAYVVAGLIMLALPLVIDRRVQPIEAIKQSYEALKGEWLMATVYYFVVAFIAGILGPITLPLLPIGVALLYREVFLAGAATNQEVPLPGGYPPTNTFGAIPYGTTPTVYGTPTIESSPTPSYGTPVPAPPLLSQDMPSMPPASTVPPPTTAPPAVDFSAPYVPPAAPETLPSAGSYADETIATADTHEVPVPHATDNDLPHP